MADRARTWKEYGEALKAALESLLVMMDRGPKPQKLDEALSWRANDELARTRAAAALALLPPAEDAPGFGSAAELATEIAAACLHDAVGTQLACNLCIAESFDQARVRVRVLLDAEEENCRALNRQGVTPSAFDAIEHLRAVIGSGDAPTVVAEMRGQIKTLERRLQIRGDAWRRQGKKLEAERRARSEAEAREQGLREALERIAHGSLGVHPDGTFVQPHEGVASAFDYFLASKTRGPDKLCNALDVAQEVLADLAAARDIIEQFQDASGLCVPAEEKGGDPGGVKPEHVRRYIEKLERDLAAARERADTAEFDLRTQTTLLANTRHVLEAARREAEEAKAIEREACAKLVDEEGYVRAAQLIRARRGGR